VKYRFYRIFGSSASTSKAHGHPDGLFGKFFCRFGDSYQGTAFSRAENSLTAEYGTPQGVP
jgi:hypothetical protein